MDDLDMLARDFGFGSRGKSNPMRSSTHSDRRSIDDPLFNDVFGGPPKYTPSSNSINSNSGKHSSMNDFDYNSIFKSSEPKDNISSNRSSNNKTASLPVYDKPVYDEDIFDGLPGVKNKSPESTVRFDDDIFASISSPPMSKNRDHKSDFDDLLGNLGRSEKSGDNYISTSAKSSSNAKEFNDLLPGFGTRSSPTANRPKPDSSHSSVPTPGSVHGNVLDDPFAGLASSSTPGSSSSGVFTDPLDEIGKLGKSKSARAEAAFDNLDSHTSFVKPSNLSGSAAPKSDTTREQKGNNSLRYSETTSQKKVPVDNLEVPPFFDVPNVSKDFQKSFGQTTPPQYYETGSNTDTPKSEDQEQQYDGIWLTVSEIPLFTQPTSAPPPSRPPPPLPRLPSKLQTGSISSSSRKKGDGVFSPSSYSQHSQSPKLAKGPPVSQYDELDDFATGKPKIENFHSSEETNAAASAAAMKDAMDKAEAKFRHAKEVREREYAKATRNKLERDEQDEDDTELRERLERERKQKEEEDREQRRIEREREREKARQAVERATREARKRAAAEARERAAAESRLRSERAAVEKANAEARARAERAAVQRAQAEARERAAAEAKERAEKAAAEARERDMRDKAAAARAEAEARRRAERSAVERAAAEARERATAEAREKAAAAATKTNQQPYNDDLESFFSMGRASSAPRTRDTTTDPFFQQFQNKGGFEAPKKAPTSTGSSSNIKKAHSATNIVDDLSSIFGGPPSSGDFQEVEGENEERRRARLDRQQRTQQRAAKALAEKNQRDVQAQREQEERHRIGETLDIEIKRWAAGKEGNLRALLSTMQYVLWPECGWQPVSLTDLITGASVKKAYRKATLCIHPDKVQQKGATLQQKYIAEKVFDLLKEAWNKFNSEELF